MCYDYSYEYNYILILINYNYNSRITYTYKFHSMEAAVQLLVGATKRALGRPVIKKTAVLKSEVIAMLDFTVPDFDNFDWGTVRAVLFAVLTFCLENSV